MQNDDRDIVTLRNTGQHSGTISALERHRIVTRIFHLTCTKDDGIDHLYGRLDSFSDEMLVRIDTFINDAVDSGSGRRVKSFLSDLIKDDPSTMSEVLHFALPLLEENHSGRVREFIRGLHCYPQLPAMDDYSKATTLVRQQCSALLRVAECFIMEPYYDISREGGVHPYLNGEVSGQENIRIADERIIQLVIDHPDSVERILRIIVDHRTIDTEFMREIICSEVPALSNGII